MPNVIRGVLEELRKRFPKIPADLILKTIKESYEQAGFYRLSLSKDRPFKECLSITAAEKLTQLSSQGD